jgi:hypothetical protein
MSELYHELTIDRGQVMGVAGARCPQIQPIELKIDRLKHQEL